MDVLEYVDVIILDSVPNVQVKYLLERSKIYLQFSDYEGMSMTTIEAIQSNSLPVVKIVGEMNSYLSKKCCIEITDTSISGLNKIIDDSIDMINDENERIEKLRLCNENIMSYKTYTDSFKLAIDSIN